MRLLMRLPGNVAGREFQAEGSALAKAIKHKRDFRKLREYTC